MDQVNKVVLSWQTEVKKTLANVAIPLVWDNLLGLVSNLTSNAINKFDRKISG